MAKEIRDWGKPQQAAPHHDAHAVIEKLLKPGEKLLWHANGRGPHWTPNNIYSALFVGAFIPFFGLLLMQSVGNGKIGGWMLAYTIAIFSIAIIVLGLAIFYAIVSPSHDCYGLTDRRVIVVRRYWSRRERSYTSDNIRNLRVRNGATGDIGFWKQDTGYVNRAWEIVGVDGPMELAVRIKATLGLTLPIEEVDVPPYIPPVTPRKP